MEGLALRIRLHTNTVAEERGSRALHTDVSIPLGTEEIRRSSVIRSDLNKGTVAIANSVTLVAGQASSICRIEGLAERIDLSADTIVKPGID